MPDDSLQSRGLQHNRFPCPSPIPGACSNSCPLSWWCHPTISSFVVPFSRLQSFPASGSFSMSEFLTPGGQSTRALVSASASQFFASVQFKFSSVTQSCLALCDPMDRSTPGLPVHHQLLEFTHTHAHWVGDAIQPSHPLSSPSPPAFSLPQHQGLFKWVCSSHQLAKVLEFSFNISPSNEHLGLISFRMDWLDLLAVQRTLKSLLQHHSSKASILWCSAFFIVQLSHPTWLLEKP